MKYKYILDILRNNGYTIDSDLNCCTEQGIEYFIGYDGNKAAIVAIVHDENIYLITKKELREMALTAKIAGIDTVELYTNYGIELHSKFEKPKTVGFNKIHKISIQ